MDDNINLDIIFRIQSLVKENEELRRQIPAKRVFHQEVLDELMRLIATTTSSTVSEKNAVREMERILGIYERNIEHLNISRLCNNLHSHLEDTLLNIRELLNMLRQNKDDTRTLSIDVGVKKTAEEWEKPNLDPMVIGMLNDTLTSAIEVVAIEILSSCEGFSRKVVDRCISDAMTKLFFPITNDEKLIASARKFIYAYFGRSDWSME